MTKKKQASLFSGIGGFDLASEWMGWENVFHCEWNPFGQKVLQYYWPNAIPYHDITQTDFTLHRGTIDVLTGGFPCQPYSQAGKRLGKADERHLWPHMLRAVREIAPRWVVGENVRGLVNWNEGMVFDEVQADLEAEGYEVQPFLLPAAGVNAPHERYRIWFVAHSNNGQHEQQNETIRTGRDAFSLGSAFTTDSGGEQLQNWTSNGNSSHQAEEGTGLDYWAERQSDTRNVADTTGERSRESFKERFSELANQDVETRGVASNASSCNGRMLCGQTSGEEKFKKYSNSSMGGRWQDFPTQSPVCNGDDGLPARLDGITFPKWRNESIKAGGNAIVPQVALQIFRAIEMYDSIYN